MLGPAIQYSSAFGNWLSDAYQAMRNESGTNCETRVLRLENVVQEELLQLNLALLQFHC